MWACPVAYKYFRFQTRNLKLMRGYIGVRCVHANQGSKIGTTIESGPLSHYTATNIRSYSDITKKSGIASVPAGLAARSLIAGFWWLTGG